MLELVKMSIDFIWTVINMPIRISSSITITIFGGMSFGIVAALFYKLIYGGGGNTDK
jgi:hypothetical protein